LHQILVLIPGINIYIHREIRYLLINSKIFLFQFENTPIDALNGHLDAFFKNYDQQREWLEELDHGSLSLVINNYATLMALILLIISHILILSFKWLIT
jgi:hypothetical protein